MISREDCIALCGLGPGEVAAIGEHEHLPDVAASALARYLLNRAGGAGLIRGMIIDDIHAALDRGQAEHAAELFASLRHFIAENPAARAGARLH